jgi:ABC-type amino acid transport substrate-binding protein
LELPQEPRFKSLIDRAIEELLYSGELDSLLRKYYGFSPYAYYPAWRPAPPTH